MKRIKLYECFLTRCTKRMHIRPKENYAYYYKRTLIKIAIAKNPQRYKHLLTK